MFGQGTRRELLVGLLAALLAALGFRPRTAPVAAAATPVAPPSNRLSYSTYLGGPGCRVTTHVYDARANLTYSEEGGSHTCYVYDALGGLKSREPEGPAKPGAGPPPSGPQGPAPLA